MGGSPRSARAALRVVVGVLACILPPCAGVWAQPFPAVQSPEPPLVGPPPLAPAALAGAAEPADPPTPTVSLHVRAPAAAAAGQEVDYRILVENPSKAAAHHVQVRAPVPANAAFVRASPEPAAREPQVFWDLGTLPPSSSKEILLTLKPGGAGDVDVIARVQFEHGQSVRTHVGAAAPPPPPVVPAAPMPPAAAPKAELRLRKTGDQSHALLNDFVRFQLEVTNVGTADAVDVALDDSLPAGLRYEPDHPSDPVGGLLHWDLGTLAPGGTRRIQYKAIATAAGDQGNVAQATGAGGLRTTASWHVQVDEPKMTATVTGPQKRLVNRPAKYQITVANAGATALAGVEVFDDLPAGVQFVQASDSGRREGNRVHWILGEAPAGARRSVTVELTADKETEAVSRVTVRADRGVTARAEAKTLFEGAAGLRVEVDKSDDPLAVGREADYTVRVFNRGTGPAKNLRLAATVPEQMQVVSKDGLTEATQTGQTLTFAPLAALDAGKDATYKVHVRAKSAGEVKLIVELKSDDLATPLHEEETTTIFGEPAAPAPASPAPPPPTPPPGPPPVPGSPP